jgi:hypothetical protein
VGAQHWQLVGIALFSIFFLHASCCSSAGDVC